MAMRGPAGFIADKHRRYEQQGAHYAIIHTDPGDLSNRVYVILPDFDPSFKWGPCRWQSRDNLTRPQSGEECLVLFDNRGDPWVVAWWPFVN